MKKYSFLLFLLIIPFEFCAQTFNVNGINYQLRENKIEVEVTFDTINKYQGHITIPNSIQWQGKTYKVTALGISAFKDCSKLTSVNLPEGLKSIGNRAFANCTNLASISIPKSVTKIGALAFDNCSKLSTINLSKNIVHIDMNAFDNQKIYDYTNLPDRMAVIYDTSRITPWFKNQPDGLIYIGKVLYVWKGEMPKNTKVIVENGTTLVADEAFKNCIGLTFIKIPESVTKIGFKAFFDCTNLKDIFTKNPIPAKCDEDCFSDKFIKTCTLHVPKGSKAKYQQAEGWKKFSNIVEE